MVCPQVDLEEVEPIEGEGSASCVTSENGPLACVEGAVEGITLEEGDEILVRLTDEEGAAGTYRAFLISNEEEGTDQGYCVYASLDLWAEQNLTADIMVQRGADVMLLDTYDVRFSA